MLFNKFKKKIKKKKKLIINIYNIINEFFSINFVFIY